jgi:autotransporter translocation and assembly factor TamB
MRNGFIAMSIALLLVLTLFVVQQYFQHVKDQAAIAEAIDRLSSAQRKYSEGVSGRDGFFENLTVRNLTVTDGNANLRIIVSTHDDGSAQISFYGEKSVVGGSIRVEKDGSFYSQESRRKTN